MRPYDFLHSDKRVRDLTREEIIDLMARPSCPPWLLRILEREMEVRLTGDQP